MDEKLTNNTNIPLALAVWLAADDYDGSNNPKYISATSLLKPTKQIILGKRATGVEGDITALIPTALGSTIHAGIEKAWTTNPQASLKRLGYPQNIIDKIVVNPDPKTVTKDQIPIYLEQRRTKEFNGWIIGGKFDMVANGLLHDNKTTSAFTYMYGTRDEEYREQMSIYRWLNQDIITEDYFRINFIFTDWSKANTYTNPKYPKQRILFRDYPFLSLDATENLIANKLAELDTYMNEPEERIPPCSDEELWRKPTKYKYYANASNTTGKCTKTFDDYTEAMMYWKHTKQGKGTVLTVPGSVQRCLYCKCFNMCKQRLNYGFDNVTA